MNATLAAYRRTHPLATGAESGVCRFRVFYLRLNGRRTVVPAWRLRDALHALKLVNLYRSIERLEDGASVEFDVTVYKQPVNLLVSAGTWEVRESSTTRG
jgi:hypothetical protein